MASKGPIRRRVAALAYLFCRHDWQEVTTYFPPAEDLPPNWPSVICNTCGKPRSG